MECCVCRRFVIQTSLLTVEIHADSGAVNHPPPSLPQTAACKFYSSLRWCCEGVHSHSRAVCRSPSRPRLAQEMKTKLRETLCFCAWNKYLLDPTWRRVGGVRIPFLAAAAAIRSFSSVCHFPQIRIQSVRL